MKTGFKDDKVMAFEIAKRILVGEIVAYRDPVDPEEIHTIPRKIALLHLPVLKAMDVLNVLQGATIEDVAEFCQWDADIINQARAWLAAGNKIGGK